MNPTLARLARVLAGEHMDVTMRADGPRLDANLIVLPELDTADDALLTGHLDRLAARATFCDNAMLERIDAPIERRVAQAIDDRRACARFVTRYAGARRYIARWREHAGSEIARDWHELAWRDKLLWLIERALWDETPARTEQQETLVATLNACAPFIDAARGSRSTAESVAISRELIARVRALASDGANTMMFTADADETLDAETVPGASGENGDSDDANEDTSFATDEGGRPLRSEPMTTAFDLVTDMTAKGDAIAWRNLRALARDETAPLRTRLERALRADEQTHWRREQERGALDRQALVRLAISPGYRTPFRVQRVSKGRDTAVSILIDRSGSMAGGKIELARLCAAALADALTQLSFPNEVLGYSSVESPDMRARYEAALAGGTSLRRFNRFVERLDLVVYKRFDSPVLEGLAAIDCGHENPDGEALAWAAGRLARQRATRRILLVLSDGMPATGDGHPVVLRRDLLMRVREITHAGIELIGVGILDDAVEQFYPVSIVVHALHELPARAFDVLAKALLRR